MDSSIGKILKVLSLITLIGGTLAVLVMVEMEDINIIFSFVGLPGTVVGAAVLYGIGTAVDNTEENKEMLKRIMYRMDMEQYSKANMYRMWNNNGQVTPKQTGSPAVQQNGPAAPTVAPGSTGMGDGVESYCMLPCPFCGKLVDVFNLDAEKRCPHCLQKIK